MFATPSSAAHAVFVPIVTFHSFLNSENLQLYKNNLEGPIPTELGKMSNLNEIRLNGNFLSGTIPKQLGNLRYLGTFLSFIGNLNCGCGEFAHVCVCVSYVAIFVPFRNNDV